MNHSILNLIFGQTWFCEQGRMDSFLLRAMSAMSEGKVIREMPRMGARPLEDYDGNEIPQMYLREDGVAVIPVSGPLAKRVTASDQWYYGLADYENIQADIETAIEQGAAAIMLEMDSPGGSVLGLSELASFIAATGEKISIGSFNGIISASAAEYLSAPVSLRLSSPSAVNGSIGTIAQVGNFEERMKMFGIKVHTFTSGDLKGTGNPYNAMPLEHAASIQSRVDALGAEFREWMQTQRGTLPASAMRGQVLTTSEALQIGLIDGVCNTLNEACAELISRG